MEQVADLQADPDETGNDCVAAEHRTQLRDRHHAERQHRQQRGCEVAEQQRRGTGMQVGEGRVHRQQHRAAGQRERTLYAPCPSQHRPPGAGASQRLVVAWAAICADMQRASVNEPAPRRLPLADQWRISIATSTDKNPTAPASSTATVRSSPRRRKQDRRPGEGQCRHAVGGQQPIRDRRGAEGVVHTYQFSSSRTSTNAATASATRRSAGRSAAASIQASAGNRNDTASVSQ